MIESLRAHFINEYVVTVKPGYDHRLDAIDKYLESIEKLIEALAWHGLLPLDDPRIITREMVMEQITDAGAMSEALKIPLAPLQDDISERFKEMVLYAYERHLEGESEDYNGPDILMSDEVHRD